MMVCMKTLNRFALIVRPASPFIEWAAQASGEPETKIRKELAEMEPTIYLLPESKAANALDPAVLRAHWRAIFKQELEDWCTDESAWPQNLSEAMFRVLFQLELVAAIHDRGKESLRLEE